jgi:predicted nucleotidyltransferase
MGIFSIRETRIENSRMVLKPQDVLVLLKLVVLGETDWTYNRLAVDLGMSPAEVHAAVRRAKAAQLVVRQAERVVPNISELAEFLTHGLRYVFVPQRGEITRGMPTRYAAPPLLGVIAEASEPPPVWPDPQGEARGAAFAPLYKSAPKAARADPALYELLVLADAIRGGRAREREIAIRELQRRLGLEPVQEKAVSNNDEDTLVIGGSIAVPRAALEQLARRYHIRRLELFGSAARGELRPDSDIDLLVEFEASAAPSLWDAQQLEAELSRLLGGRKVDIAPPEILRNPYRRKTIERDAQVLYEAA